MFNSMYKMPPTKILPLLCLLLSSPCFGVVEKYSTLLHPQPVDTKTLASIVTDIDAHYDHLLSGYSAGNDSVGVVGGEWGWGGGAGQDVGVGWVDPVDPGVQVVEQVGQLHPFENSVSFEGSGLKLALVLVSLWYLIIAVLAASTTGSIFGSSCPTHLPPHSLPLDDHGQLIDANGVAEFVEPHPNHASLASMFLHGGGGSSEESETMEMPMELLGRVGEMCPTNAFFYGQNSAHMSAAMMVKDMFMAYPPLLMLDMAMRVKPAMNSKLWYTGLMHACASRGDVQGLPLPTALDAMPDSFIPGIVDKSRHSKSDHCLKLDSKIGVDNGVENKLWYFREDVFMNAHHWYWHLAWPLMTRGGKRMDRRGELFYYAHRGFVQRYNIERLSNHLPLTTALDYSAPVTPGYHPHLTQANAGQDWTPRERLAFLTDINHRDNPSDRVEIRIKDWLGRLGRVYKAVKSGWWVTPLGPRRIPPKTGIDQLGNTVEAVDVSVNPGYYGRDGFHNDGHRVLGYIEDPGWEKMLPPGVMADPSTAMRDPIFYRFHTNINDIFEKYKATLPAYTKEELSFPGVTLQSIELVPKSGQVNHLRTFFSKKKFSLHMGLAFNRSGLDEDEEEVDVCAKHLDHEEWEYVIKVHRAPCAKSKSATFRIFLAPKYNLHGDRFTLEEQRRLFVHLDVFNVQLPTGPSTITRSSLASSLTTPPIQTLSQVNQKGQTTHNCGCGWPQHLLLPKGTKNGMDVDVFVMATNGDDYIHPKGGQGCGKAWLFCGVGGGYYPDSRPMGFPFDREMRVGRTGFRWLEEWMGVVGGSVGRAEVRVVHGGKEEKEE